MIFIDSVISEELDEIFYWYREEDRFRLFDKHGIELIESGFKKWYFRYGRMILDPNVSIHTIRGSFVVPMMKVLTITSYKGKMLLTNTDKPSVYTPNHPTIPVCYYFNNQLKELVEYINSCTNFRVV